MKITWTQFLFCGSRNNGQDPEEQMSIKKEEYAPPTCETVEPSTGNCLAEIGNPAAIHRDDACKVWGLWSNCRVHTIRVYNWISRMWLKMLDGARKGTQAKLSQTLSNPAAHSAVRCDCGCQHQPPDFKTQPTVFTPHAGWKSNSAECWVTANPTLTINAKQRETCQHHGPNLPRFRHTHADTSLF